MGKDKWIYSYGELPIPALPVASQIQHLFHPFDNT
jgi:hypothetical protein